MNQTANKRLLALDVLRGITIAGMIMVNNPGSWSYVYAPLGHAAWIGLTPTDLVFPFFMFIMGISTYISLRKYNFEFSHSAALKILKRTIVIFAIGLGIAWFSMFCHTWNSLSGEDIPFFSRLGESVWTFSHIRILGVMQRLALCYGATAIIALIMKHKYIPYLIAKASAMRPCLLLVLPTTYGRYILSALTLLFSLHHVKDRFPVMSVNSSGSVENNGFEPLTPCVQGRCSSQLS